MTAAAPPDPKLPPDWKERLRPAWQTPGFAALRDFLHAEKAAGKRIFPPGPRIFAAFDHTPWDAVRVVLLGQDPYHGPGQANGLCFSVARGVPTPPSLVNIFKERQTDLGLPPPGHGDLSGWARRGVLLLNATLTVEAHRAESHKGRGWEAFTDAVIRRLSEERSGLVFLLWGRNARAKKALIDAARHAVIESAHPSPLSAHAGFFGSQPFSKTNAALERFGHAPLDWQLD
jgi:uracil-DNA glycosylase